MNITTKTMGEQDFNGTKGDGQIMEEMKREKSILKEVSLKKNDGYHAFKGSKMKKIMKGAQVQ